MDFCFFFAKSMSKILSIEYSQKLLNSAKKPTTKATKTASKRGLQKTAEATGDLIGDKIADKITDDSKMSPTELQSTELYSKIDHGNSAIEVPKKRYISPEERQQIIDELRLV